MRYHYLIEQIYFRPWFISGPAWASIHQTFSAAVKRKAKLSVATKADDDGDDDGDGSELDFSDFVNARKPYEIDGDGIASVHVLGPMARGLSKMERACGATGYEEIQSDIARAIDEGAKGLLLKFDSGGGTVNGCPETAESVSACAQLMPVVTHTADMIGSAAFYVGCGATKVIATRSAAVGSIGTLIPWVDFSEQLRAEGLVGDPITNKEGDLKGAGFITGSLTATQRQEWQNQAQEMFADFKTHVLAHRAVPDSAMRGQLLYGQGALDANLIDEFGDEAHARAVLRGLIGG